jgi:hypothetical protein
METIIDRFLPPLNSSRTMWSLRADLTTTRAENCRMSVRTAAVAVTLLSLNVPASRCTEYIVPLAGVAPLLVSLTVAPAWPIAHPGGVRQP